MAAVSTTRFVGHHGGVATKLWRVSGCSSLDIERASSGAKCLVVLGHGLKFSKELWWPAVKRVSQYLPVTSSIDFVAFDLPGHGESTLREQVPVKDWFSLGVEYALETVKHYAPRYDRIMALGHSFGAASLMLLEAQQPGTFERLLVYEPILLPQQLPDAFVPLLNQLPIARKARAQQNGWRDTEAARSYFSARRAFSTWNADILDLYLQHCLKQDRTTGEVTLKMDPEIEADAFASVPSPFSSLQSVRAQHAVAYGELSKNLDSIPSSVNTGELYRDLAGFLPGLGRAVECCGYGHLVVCEDPDLVARHCVEYLVPGQGMVATSPVPKL